MNPTHTALDTAPGVDRLLAEGFALRHVDTRRALALCEQAEAAALRIDYQHGVAYGRLRTGLCLLILGERSDEVMALLYQAQALLEGLGDLHGQSESLNLLANLLDSRDQHQSALELHLRALQLRQKLGDSYGEGASLANIGDNFSDRAQFAEALQYAFMSLELAQRLDDVQTKAYANNLIGKTLLQMGDTQNAMSHLLEAVQQARAANDRAKESTVLSDMGLLLTQTGHLADAFSYLERAHALALQVGNQEDLAKALLGLGLAHQKAGALSLAESHLRQALDLRRARSSRSGQAEVLLALGRNEWLAGATGAAIDELQHALALIEPLQADHIAGQLHQLLSQVHEHRDDARLALRHFQAFYACQQRIHNQDSQRRIRALMQRNALERVQQDAEAARRRGDELSVALDQARAAERHKDELLARLSEQSELLRQLAREDGLTGLANRRWLDAQLTRERERARRHGHALTVAMIDIDHFKRINDRFSHRVGDEVLRRMGHLLRDAFRTGDIIGRYGGEEFMVVLVETPLQNALIVCERLRERVAELVLSDLHPELRQVTVSIGVAGDLPDPVAVDPVALADEQLYCAKELGRNRLCWAGRPPELKAACVA
ncbi:diguanylate cyclase [Ideonella sp.]|uniref:diguanylate cyclase n=1 Tax=Ideonella sp. TaxID=1929293 RepID=UPI003BB76C75